MASFFILKLIKVMKLLRLRSIKGILLLGVKYGYMDI